MELCLDREPALADGDDLPALWHWIYFIEPVPTSDLGVDGHERLGRFLPPIRYPRRMWAGGDVVFRVPLIIGRDAEKTTSIGQCRVQAGTLGASVFRHRAPSRPAARPRSDRTRPRPLSIAIPARLSKRRPPPGRTRRPMA